MKMNDTAIIIGEYSAFLQNKQFPCIAAKAALARQQVKCMVADNMACPKDDLSMLQFLYGFVDEYRNSTELYHTAAVIFKAPAILSEEIFDDLLWGRLQAISNMDAKNHLYDKRVNNAPSSPNFSFSIKEEAFFIIGLHKNSSRQSRQFNYPTLVFNPHAQFEQLRNTARYDTMKNVVRKRDIMHSGSINPMLEDFGKSSEVYQYSGISYDHSWQCPLKINHATDNNFTP